MTALLWGYACLVWYLATGEALQAVQSYVYKRTKKMYNTLFLTIAMPPFLYVFCVLVFNFFIELSKITGDI